MKILVTGSNGQLGSEIKTLSGNYPGFDFVFTDVDELDLTAGESVFSFFDNGKFDVCINCAAYTAVDKAEDEEHLAELVNATAAGYLAEACSRHNALLVHISTDYVFDGTNYKPYVETDTPSPNSSYGRSKLHGEKQVSEKAKKWLIFRTAWLYSKYGNNFVKTMLRLGKERDELGVVVDQIGTPTAATDLAKAILDVIKSNGNKPIAEIYHYSNEGVISWYDFAMAIMDEAGLKCKVKAIESKDFPAKANRPYYSVLNKRKIKSDFGVKVPYWLDSLKETIKNIK
jgi:dTDP-4-dehydrorhamnose reductase